jgi:nicotinamidase-related amidase
MLSRNSAVLVIIDIQGNLFQVMHDRESLVMNAVKVIKGAAILNLPIVLTQQIPEKLGQTIEPIVRELSGVEPIDKESFSCWESESFREKLTALGRGNIIILGIECHVCVYQTAIDLMQNGYTVHVVGDAVSSRTKENIAAGLAAMKDGGAHWTSSEMVLFELLRTAADPRAREIFKIIK